MKSTMRAIAVAVALLMVLGACQGTSDDDASEPLEIDTSTNGFDPAILPDRPADEESEFGSFRFAEYVRIVMDYTAATSDLDPLRELILPNHTCGGCDQFAQIVTDNSDTRAVAHEPTAIDSVRRIPSTDDAIVIVVLEIRTPAGRVIDAETGETVEELAEGEPRDAAFYLQWQNDQWYLLDITTHAIGELEGAV